MPRYVKVLIALGVAGSLAGGAGIEALAPVVNSGSGVVAVAFLSGLYTYRRLKARTEEKEEEAQNPLARP